MLGVKSSRHFDLCFHRPVLQLRIQHAGASVLFCCHISCHESLYVCARKNIRADQECGGSSSQRAVNILRLLGRTVRSVQDALHKAKQAVTCFTSLSVDQLDSGMRVIPVKRGLKFSTVLWDTGAPTAISCPPGMEGPVKNIYTKSETPTVTCRKKWAWFEKVNLYNWQIMILPRKKKYMEHSWAPGSLYT
jgi:hypothetical protein